mmetsp:Transcript_38460/g.95978  ORF Transcript_38460/g.95978 Transcript_38460/m.95978 type:complete len:267 (+) Transcript_38460:245-1045(+)
MPIASVIWTTATRVPRAPRRRAAVCRSRRSDRCQTAGKRRYSATRSSPLRCATTCFMINRTSSSGCGALSHGIRTTAGTILAGQGTGGRLGSIKIRSSILTTSPPASTARRPIGMKASRLHMGGSTALRPLCSGSTPTSRATATTIATARASTSSQSSAHTRRTTRAATLSGRCARFSESSIGKPIGKLSLRERRKRSDLTAIHHSVTAAATQTHRAAIGKGLRTMIFSILRCACMLRCAAMLTGCSPSKWASPSFATSIGQDSTR